MGSFWGDLLVVISKFHVNLFEMQTFTNNVAKGSAP